MRLTSTSSRLLSAHALLVAQQPDGFAAVAPRMQEDMARFCQIMLGIGARSGIMIQRDGKGNPDNSDVRIAFQEAAAKGLGQ
jgi:hypothetical protein